MKTRLDETNKMRKLMGLPLLNEQHYSNTGKIKGTVIDKKTNQPPVVPLKVALIASNGKVYTHLMGEVDENGEYRFEREIPSGKHTFKVVGLNSGFYEPIEKTVKVKSGETNIINFFIEEMSGVSVHPSTDERIEMSRVKEINLKDELEELEYLAEKAKEKKESDKEKLKSFLKGVKNNKKLSKKIASKQKELDKLESDLDKYKGPEHFKKHKKQIINKVLTVIGAGIIGTFNLLNGEDKVNDALNSVREKLG